MTERQEFYTPQEAAAFLRFAPTTLAIWRSQATGPAYIKVGKPVRYRYDDLLRWATAAATERATIEEAAECHATTRARAKRARGRAGVAQRQRRLEAEPMCRDCRAEGYDHPSEEIDHVLPLHAGGQDTDDNIRALCRGCHAARTREARLPAMPGRIGTSAAYHAS